MERRKRIEYLIVTWMVFVSVIFMFYFTGDFTSTFPVENEAQFRLAGSLMMGYIITGMLSGIMLAAGFFEKRSLLFKGIAAALWFVTMLAVFAAGEFLLIPYQIYNLIQIIRGRCAERGTEWAEKETAPDEGETHAD